MMHAAIKTVAARRTRPVALGLAILFLAVPSSAQVLRDPPTPFGPLVYDNSFPDPASAGVSNGLKNIPLRNEPGWYVKFGGSLRERFESFANSAFGFRAAGGVRSED